jgi:hypothetical protein
MNNTIQYQSCPSCHTFCGSTYYTGSILTTGSCKSKTSDCGCTKSSVPNHTCSCNTCKSSTTAQPCNTCDTTIINDKVACNPITSGYQMPKCNYGCIDLYDANCVIGTNQDGQSENIQDILSALYSEISILKDKVACLTTLNPSCNTTCEILLNPISIN